METEEQLEREAERLFGCKKDMLKYLVESAGSIGPSKLSSYTQKIRN